MLQYALLHLFGYDLTIDDLKSFRVSSIVERCPLFVA
jgi:transketolase